MIEFSREIKALLWKGIRIPDVIAYVLVTRPGMSYEKAKEWVLEFWREMTMPNSASFPQGLWMLDYRDCLEGMVQ
jgi:hypothetical protein